MFVGIRVCTDLHAAQAKLADATGQLTGRELRILERDCPKTSETRGIGTRNFANVIVQDARKIERITRSRPITEHTRYRGKHLQRNAGRVHLVYPAHRLPHAVGNFAKNLIADHHARAAWLVMFKPDKPGITVFSIEIGPLPWKNMGVKINLHSV